MRIRSELGPRARGVPSGSKKNLRFRAMSGEADSNSRPRRIVLKKSQNASPVTIKLQIWPYEWLSTDSRSRLNSYGTNPLAVL